MGPPDRRVAIGRKPRSCYSALPALAASDGVSTAGGGAVSAVLTGALRARVVFFAAAPEAAVFFAALAEEAVFFAAVPEGAVFFAAAPEEADFLAALVEGAAFFAAEADEVVFFAALARLAGAVLAD